MYGVRSRHDLNSNEKCPRCLTIFQDFIDLDKGLLGCYRCGSVFVSKDIRDAEYRCKKEKLEKLKESLKCHICGKACKSKLGLTSHLKSHPKENNGS